MNVFEEVSKILKELSGVTDILEEQELQYDLVMDSIQMVMLLMLLEETFQIVFDESDMNPFSLVTVQDVISLVQKYVNAEEEKEREENEILEFC